MKTMLTFILTLLITGISSSQVNDVYTKFIAPKFIPQNSQFQIVALVKKNTDEIDSLELRLEINSEIRPDSVSVINGDSLSLIDWKEKTSEDFGKTGYSVFLNFQDSLIASQNFTEVVYYLNSDSRRKIDYRFNYRYKLLTDSSFISSFPLAHGTEEEIESYKISQAKGLAELLDNKGTLTLFGNFGENNQNLIFSYWLKFERLGEAIFSFYQGESDDSLCSISVGGNGLLKYCDSESLTIFEDFAFSPNAWYKMECFVEPENDEILFFINGDLLAEKKVFSSYSIKKVTIGISSLDSRIIFDDVKILKYSGSYEKFLNEEHRLKSLPDSLSVAFSDDFNEPQNNAEENKCGIKATNVKSVLSDAPVFIPLPELNLSIYSTYYFLEWKAAENTFPEEFVLEKSVDGIEYTEINRQSVSEDERTKTFSFTDAKSFTDEVIYYRVLQTNKDGSEVYSNQVKVGQGEIEEFSVEQNYPNPFGGTVNSISPVTNIKVEVFVPGEYKISVFDVVGKQIQLLHSGPLSTGVHSFAFDGTELPSGIYFYEVVSPHSTKVMKMILAK
jgi:hypothetical protein